MHNYHLFSIIMCNKYYSTVKQTDGMETSDDKSLDVGIKAGAVLSPCHSSWWSIHGHILCLAR